MTTVASAPPGVEPHASVVVRTRDEAARLRLTLASLAVQSAPAEVVVVDDGSMDDTSGVIAAASAEMTLRVIRHDRARGRSAATNAGAAVATGRIVIFLDGDTLAERTLVADHVARHGSAGHLIVRGETWHVRCTRHLLDPETVQAQTEHESRIAALSDCEREALRITCDQVRDDFAAIVRRAQPGIYPGHGPRRLHELEFDALRRHPDCDVLWAAASGSNLSVRRVDFASAGGFDPRLDLNEHRELALRLCERGGRMVPLEGARTIHMTHRAGWRDPLQQRGWLAVMEAAHPRPSVRLLPIFWAGLSDGAAPAIASLPDLATRAAAEGEPRLPPIRP